MSINLKTQPHPGSNSNISWKRKLTDTEGSGQIISLQNQVLYSSRKGRITETLHSCNCIHHCPPPLLWNRRNSLIQIVTTKLCSNLSVASWNWSTATMHHIENSIVCIRMKMWKVQTNSHAPSHLLYICNKMSWGAGCLGGTTWRYLRHRLQGPSLQDLVWVLEHACVGFGRLFSDEIHPIYCTCWSSTLVIVQRLLQPAAVTWVPQCG